MNSTEPEDTVEIEAPLERGTQAALEYFWGISCDMRLFHLVTDTVVTGDFVAHVARKALEGHSFPLKGNDPEGPSRLATEDPGPRTRALRKSRQELLEMFVGRAVDNFQVYVVEVIRDVLKTRPEILSARKQEISLGHILKFETIDELVLDMIESRVTGLSYQGFGDLQEWCESKSIPLLVPSGDEGGVIELIALRNVIVHNRGCVDARYQAAVGSSAPEVGQTRKLDVDEYFLAIDLLNRVVNLTDAAIAGKFKLERVDVRARLTERSEKQLRSVKPSSESVDAARDPGEEMGSS